MSTVLVQNLSELLNRKVEFFPKAGAEIKLFDETGSVLTEDCLGMCLAPKTPDTIVTEFDYVIVDYYWQGSSPNIDALNGRINLISPKRGFPVGYASPNDPAGITHRGLAYLFDNNGGVVRSRPLTESFLIDFRKVLELYPDIGIFEFTVGAGWDNEAYTSPGGAFGIQIRTFIGGQNSLDFDYRWQNEGGTLVHDTGVIPTATINRFWMPFYEFGTIVGRVKYNRATQGLNVETIYPISFTYNIENQLVRGGSHPNSTVTLKNLQGEIIHTFPTDSIGAWQGTIDCSFFERNEIAILSVPGSPDTEIKIFWYERIVDYSPVSNQLRVRFRPFTVINLVNQNGDIVGTTTTDVEGYGYIPINNAVKEVSTSLRFTSPDYTIVDFTLNSFLKPPLIMTQNSSDQAGSAAQITMIKQNGVAYNHPEFRGNFFYLEYSNGMMGAGYGNTNSYYGYGRNYSSEPIAERVSKVYIFDDVNDYGIVTTSTGVTQFSGVAKRHRFAANTSVYTIPTTLPPQLQLDEMFFGTPRSISGSNFEAVLGWDLSNVKTASNAFRMTNWTIDLSSLDVRSIVDFRGFLADNNNLGTMNLSNWCVPLVSAEPLNFATITSTNTKAIPPERMPVWGTCPNG